jgi:hypothetical protein
LLFQQRQLFAKGRKCGDEFEELNKSHGAPSITAAEAKQD